MSRFETDLEFEKENFNKQDTFYNTFKGIDKIIRTNFDNINGRKLQENDIDVVLLSNEGRTYTISEKHVRNNYGNLLIEVYSSIESFVSGWMEKSKAKNLVYFIDDEYVPEVVVVNMQELQEVFKKYKILEQVKSKCGDFCKSNKHSADFLVNICNKEVNCRIIKAQNEGYTTLSICIPYSALDIDIKKYYWNGKKKS